MVGFDTSDDACVYQLREDLAIIQTVDFFPPVVDDPYTYGQIAATNALSDVYAMGGSPNLAMNLICFPNCLPLDVLEGILQGGYDKVREAGAIIVGGHTIEDPEPKYGLCVTGFLHPKDVLANSTAKEGDLLVLTKPLGLGVMTTANKADLASPEEYQEMVRLMTTLNKGGQEAMLRVGGAHACTDVTGFGMLGHTYEMASGCGMTVELYAKDLPLIPSAVEYAKMVIIPSGAYENRNYLEEKVSFGADVPEVVIDLLCDPQTAGGLLIALPEDKAVELVKQLDGVTPCAKVVGEVKAYSGKSIEVR